MSNSNQALASGYGMGNPSIGTAWKYAVTAAIINIVGFMLFAFFSQSIVEQHSQIKIVRGSFITTGNAEVANFFGTLYYVMIALGIGAFIYELWLGSFVSKRIQTTSVSVYEDKIKGVAVGRDFSIAKLIFFSMGWDKARLNNFDIALSQITSIDLAYDNAITINAPGASYKCFVSNGSEIQDVINNKIRNG